MKKVRRSFAAALLLFALTVVAVADGQIGTPLTPTTRQGQPDAISQEQIDNPLATNSTTGDVAGQTGAPLTDIALALLQNLPMLF